MMTDLPKQFNILTDSFLIEKSLYLCLRQNLLMRIYKTHKKITNMGGIRAKIEELDKKD